MMVTSIESTLARFLANRQAPVSSPPTFLPEWGMMAGNACQATMATASFRFRVSVDLDSAKVTDASSS